MGKKLLKTLNSFHLALIGFLLAQGAPIGYIIHYWLFGDGSVLGGGGIGTLGLILQSQKFELTYIWIGTSVAFSLFGWWANGIVSRMRDLYRLQNRYVGMVAHDLRRSPVAAGQDPINILLADDDPDAQLVFRMFVKDLPVRLNVVSSGKDAIIAAKNRHWDLIFLDGYMAEGNGWDVCREIRCLECQNGRLANTVYALTGATNVTAKEKISAAGFNGILTKPLKKEELRKIIRDNAPIKNNISCLEKKHA